jgi:hypothetical protein
MALFIKQLALTPLNRMGWLNGKIVISLRSFVPPYLKLTCLLVIGEKLLLPEHTLSTGYLLVLCNSKPPSRFSIAL